MNKISDPLTAATALLAQREAFQKWSNGSTASWHKKWFASSRTKFIMMGLLAAVVGGFALGFKMIGIGLAPPAPVDAVWIVGGGVVMFLSAIVFCGVVTDDVSIKKWFDPLLNRQSKAYGVRFHTHHPRTHWGEYPQDQKTRLLSQMAQLDGSWASVKSGLLPLINSSDLPYVWWQQMEHVIEQGVEQQRARTYHTRQKDEFLRAQNQVEAQIQPSVDVETHATTPVPPSKPKNISL